MYAMHIYIRKPNTFEKTLAGEYFFNSYEHALAALAEGRSDITECLPYEYSDVDLSSPCICVPSQDKSGYGTDLEFRYRGITVCIFEPEAMD